MAINLTPTNLTDLRDTCRQYRGNLGAIDVSNMTDFSNLFNTSEFQAWNNNDFNGIEQWNVSKARNLSYMFYGCRNFNRSLVNWTPPSDCRNFSFMFYGCTSLNSDMSFTTADVGFNSSTFTYESMFERCTSFNNKMPKVDISFQQGGSINLRNMFKGCTSFNQTRFTLTPFFQGGKIIADSMFEGCTSLTSILAFGFTMQNQQSENPISGVRMFYGCTRLTTSGMELFSDCSYMYAECTSLTTTSGLNSGNILYEKPIKLDHMFYNCRNFNYDISNIKTNFRSSIESMFEGCTSFNQPIGKWIFYNCSNYNRAFYGATSFNKDLSSWFLRKTDTYVDMFTNCPIQTNYKPYPLNGVVLFKPTNRDELKQYCDDISNDIGLVDTSLITDMSYMFENSTRPESDMIKLIRWDFSNVVSIRGMFKGCPYGFYYNNTRYLDLIDFSNVEDASELFMDCTSNGFYFGSTYQKIDFPKLKNASSMYENNTSNYCYCWYFNTDKLERMDNIFKNTRFNGSVFSSSTYRGYGNWNLSNLISMDGAFLIVLIGQVIILFILIFLIILVLQIYSIILHCNRHLGG